MGWLPYSRHPRRRDTQFIDAAVSPSFTQRSAPARRLVDHSLVVFHESSKINHQGLPARCIDFNAGAIEARNETMVILRFLSLHEPARRGVRSWLRRELRPGGSRVYEKPFSLRFAGPSDYAWLPSHSRLPRERRSPDAQVDEVLDGFGASSSFRGKKLLLIIPDGTRTAPIGRLFKGLHARLSGEAARIDIIIALGTHPAMSEEAINKRLEITAEERATLWGRAGV